MDENSLPPLPPSPELEYFLLYEFDPAVLEPDPMTKYDKLIKYWRMMRIANSKPKLCDYCKDQNCKYSTCTEGVIAAALNRL